MTRTRKSAKDAGTRFERLMAAYFAKTLDDDGIERRARNGSRDRGDISGMRAHGQRLVVECKDYTGRECIPKWLREAEVERENDGALAGVVVSHRRGISPETNPGDQLVTMTASDFLALVSGVRR